MPKSCNERLPAIKRPAIKRGAVLRTKGGGGCTGDAEERVHERRSSKNRPDGCGSDDVAAAKGAGACALALRSCAFRGVSNKLPSWRAPRGFRGAPPMNYRSGRYVPSR